MQIREIQAILAAEVFTGADKLDLEVEAGFGSDLMSDVLAFARGRVALLTGLTNTHVLHTASMVDAAVVVFVRGKRPDQNLIDAAAGMGLPLLGTRLLMYDSCGRLFQAGLKGCSGEVLAERGTDGEKPVRSTKEKGIPGDKKPAGKNPVDTGAISGEENCVQAASGAIDPESVASGERIPLDKIPRGWKSAGAIGRERASNNEAFPAPAWKVNPAATGEPA